MIISDLSPKPLKYTLIFSVLFSSFVLSDHLSHEKIKKRIMPTGSVYKVGDKVKTPPAAVVKKVMIRTGKSIYESKCVACHGIGIAGAPKLGDKASWAPRIQAGKVTLLKNAMNGLNAMPPKGTCSDCSKKDIEKTIEYMVANSQ
jgi:cytochrome c5